VADRKEADRNHEWLTEKRLTEITSG